MLVRERHVHLLFRHFCDLCLTFIVISLDKHQTMNIREEWTERSNWCICNGIVIWIACQCTHEISSFISKIFIVGLRAGIGPVETENSPVERHFLRQEQSKILNRIALCSEKRSSEWSLFNTHQVKPIRCDQLLYLFLRHREQIFNTLCLNSIDFFSENCVRDEVIHQKIKERHANRSIKNDSQ